MNYQAKGFKYFQHPHRTKGRGIYNGCWVSEKVGLRSRSVLRNDSAVVSV